MPSFEAGTNSVPLANARGSERVSAPRRVKPGGWSFYIFKLICFVLGILMGDIAS
jgi:hypothetical protein